MASFAGDIVFAGVISVDWEGGAAAGGEGGFLVGGFSSENMLFCRLVKHIQRRDEPVVLNFEYGPRYL